MNRRTTIKLLAGGALTAAGLPMVQRHASAQERVLVPNTYQNFKRGTIQSLHPERRIFNIVWEDLGRVKMRAADLVTNYAQLKVGNIVDVQWYDYVDFLIAKKSAQADARAKSLVATGAELEGIPGAQQRIGLWRMDGMCTKVDAASNTIFVINASAGRPEEPTPASGEVIQMPQIQTAAGIAAMKTLKPGEELITVWSQQTAIKVTIIR
ncbi:hypothetical protein BH11PSE3_BH11PSE3_26250 [soil metagenome]